MLYINGRREYEIIWVILGARQPADIVHFLVYLCKVSVTQRGFAGW
jgi:hypothetical protein